MVENQDSRFNSGAIRADEMKRLSPRDGSDFIAGREGGHRRHVVPPFLDELRGLTTCTSITITNAAASGRAAWFGQGQCTFEDWKRKREPLVAA